MRLRFTGSLTLLLAFFLLTSFATAQVTFTSTFYADSQTGEALGVSSGDFNRDGKPDVAVGTGEGVDVWSNIGSGKFSGPVSYPTGGEAVGSVRAVDINNDGWLDLVVATFANTGTASPTLATLINNGNGTFRNGTTIATQLPPQSFAPGDLNNDGKVDLVVLTCVINGTTEKCQFEVLLGSGTGTFSPHQTLAIASAAVSGPVLADMNGDGKLDLVNTRSPKVFVWPGTGSGSFGTPVSFQPPGTDGVRSPVVGDFNNDARLDIAVLQDHCDVNGCDNTSSQSVYVYKNNGSLSFSLASTSTPPGAAGSSLYVSDLNGDQNMDLILLNDNFRYGDYEEYLLGKGNLTFGSAMNGPGGNTDLVARDFNLDSRHDLAISSQFGGGWVAAINTNAYTNCAPPSAANLAAKICGPANNSSVASPVLVRASGNSPAGIQRLEVWIDGVKKYEKWNDQLAKKFTLAAGSHKITVIAVDMYKGTAKTSVTVTVH
jgi:hypothetical protein